EAINSHLTGTCVNCGLLQSAEWLTKRKNCGGQVKADDYKTTNVRGFPTAGKKMRLKDGAVPSKFCWTEKEKSANVDRQLRAERRQLQHDIIVDQDVDMVDESVIVIDSSIEMLHVEEVETVADKTTTQDVQTNAGPILLESSSQTGSDPLHSNRMIAAAYKNNPRGIQFYTGIDNYEICPDSRGHWLWHKHLQEHTFGGLVAVECSQIDLT
ncbi:hypothetical protein LSH36_144g00000, partial [Paralvinella palmiformis]